MGVGSWGGAQRPSQLPTWGPYLSPQHPRDPCLTWLRCGLRLSQPEMRPTQHPVTWPSLFRSDPGLRPQAMWANVWQPFLPKACSGGWVVGS